ncbi:protein S100-A4-like [Aquarana catesbeiana]|uniref:protein S100-A4-like n=1 Tax=Aquarana catesbeiana TaxID=8400 RepID=UPI003CC99456
MTAILKPTNKMFCLLIFLSLFSAYSTKDSNLKVEEILVQLVKKFESYAPKCSEEKDMLSTKEMSDFITAEFPIFNVKGDDYFLKEIISDMDVNKDKKVTFEEFIRFLAPVAFSIKDIIVNDGRRGRGNIC